MNYLKVKVEKAPAPSKKSAAPEEELDAADAVLAQEPKTSNPFDAMPKGSFNMDDFKRYYSNEEDTKSIPYFWEKFDPTHYSIWFGEYLYNKDLTKVCVLTINVEHTRKLLITFK